MENPILHSLKARKSVRVFLDKPIPEEICRDIIAAALQAPSAGCQMLYSIINVTDQTLKDRLAVTCDNQRFIAEAHLVLVFLADCRRWYDSYRYAQVKNVRPPSESDLMLACADAVIAAQNTVVAAEAFEVGSCYIGDIMEQVEEHRALLHLDEYVYPAAMLVFGYPTDQQKKRPKPERFHPRHLVFENHYRRLSEAEHREMLSDWAARSGKQNFDFDNYLSQFCARKYMSDFSSEMARSMKVYLRAFSQTE